MALNTQIVLNFVRYLAIVFGLFVFISLVGIGMYGVVSPPTTWLMVLRKFQSKEFTYTYQFVPYEKISIHAKRAVIASEDQLFIHHYGFDLQAIRKALNYNNKHRKKRGASTISQQTAKNIFLWPSRTWLRKGLEVWFTIGIELFYSKRRILELYLNCIEMGPCVFGIEAAAKYYYHTSASKLNADQAATLAALLPSPIKLSFLKNRRQRFHTRVMWIKRQMPHVDIP